MADIIDLAPSALTILAESATPFLKSGTVITSSISKNTPIIGNVAICTDSVCTTGRAAINLYCSPNPLSKVFFGASCLCGVMGAASSGTALVTSFAGIPMAGWLGSFGARGFNSLGKYAFYMGNVTNGNITNATEIIKLMS